ncbi:alpha/beta hydrolase-fold protein [Nibrella saemangeumensis]|uniref:Alpha/beta hydrolase-fold protein n=1 Tax=Nibrella saemangeumensis TaxID=1084526 RepID=A0ABP8NL86_9BACT
MKTIYAFIFILLSLGSTYAQKPYTMTETVTYNVKSSSSQSDYQLIISLPDGYKAGDTTRYPVLYLLDGYFFTPMVASLQRFYAMGGEVPKTIVVGISYPVTEEVTVHQRRTYDYTPTADTRTTDEIAAFYKVPMESGGGARFLQTLRDDILPFVDKNFKTTSDRALCGHSFGGLFGTYTLLHAPELFNRYLLSSPSFPWADQALFKDEEMVFKSGRKSLPARVYFSMGGNETDYMISPYKRMLQNLRERQYRGLYLEEHIYEKESHTSVVPTAFAQGLRAIYRQDKKP